MLTDRLNFRIANCNNMGAIRHLEKHLASEWSQHIHNSIFSRVGILNSSKSLRKYVFLENDHENVAVICIVCNAEAASHQIKSTLRVLAVLQKIQMI